MAKPELEMRGLTSSRRPFNFDVTNPTWPDYQIMGGKYIEIAAGDTLSLHEHGDGSHWVRVTRSEGGDNWTEYWIGFKGERGKAFAEGNLAKLQEALDYINEISEEASL